VGALDSGGQGSVPFQQKWLNMGIAMTVTSSVGASALVAAMPLALPKHDRTPWWAWLSGGLGVGVTAFSIAYGITADPKPDTSCKTTVLDPTDARACVNRGEQTSLAVLTGLTAAPLLTIPLVYLLRRKDSSIAPSLEISRSRAYISFGGSF
jgi:hypothetical protein